VKHWLEYTTTERLQILDIVAAAKSLPRLAIEKDWWVTMTLKALSQSKYAHLMSFKGGTSLSKGWNLINRFSEDIDIALRREDKFAISSSSTNQLTKLRRATRHYIVRELPIELENIFGELGLRDVTIRPELSKLDDNGNETPLSATTHPSTITIHYKSIVPEVSSYIQPTVKIEISCLSMDEPIETKTLRSLIAEEVDDVEDVAVAFACVVPTRTFIEKIFLLHEEFQKERPRSVRMSRHLYDIEKMMDTPFGEAIHDDALYNAVVAHRRVYNNQRYVNYELHENPHSIFCRRQKSATSGGRITNLCAITSSLMKRNYHTTS
jgi:hypothetical protein